jgi:hypothetical protein
MGDWVCWGGAFGLLPHPGTKLVKIIVILSAWRRYVARFGYGVSIGIGEALSRLRIDFLIGRGVGCWVLFWVLFVICYTVRAVLEN